MSAPNATGATAGSGAQVVRNIFLLAVCQALAQSGNTIMLSITALAALSFGAPREWSNLPISLQHVGVMLSAFPAAMIARSIGRRAGFRTGSMAGIAGGAICAGGLHFGSFAMLCAGGLVLGYAIANMQMYRFAAVELAPVAMRAKSIAWVTAGGVAAGILGPGLARTTPDLLAPQFLATYFAVVCLHVVALWLLGRIEFPPVVESQVSGPQRPLREIARQPSYIVAVVGGMMAFGVMSFIMSASPLAIVACGLSYKEAPVTIFVHVMGMFVPAFFTGNLINRYGVINMMMVGAALLLAGVAVALSGQTEWHFRIALGLNGVGWNFMFVGATTLVTTSYRPSEKAKAQALNDFLIFGTTAISSVLSSQLLELYGWASLNILSIILVGVVVAALIWLKLKPGAAPA
ncbi:MAG: MFS transporter [Rhodospirillales bacterium]|nr:MAG: MFS transporter [Rhodospirillales bacterium]